VQPSPRLARAGASSVTHRPEPSRPVHRTLSLIRGHGRQAGLVFNPASSLDAMDHVMDLLDVVLLMSVNPGFGGQSFIPGTLAKLRDARARIDRWTQQGGQPILLEVDGGVKVDNIAQIRAAGADTFVAGSAISGKPDYGAVIQALRDEIAKAGTLTA